MVVDPVGTPAQLAARGLAANWSGLSFADLVDRELALMESLHLTADSTQVIRETKRKKWTQKQFVCSEYMTKG